MIGYKKSLSEWQCLSEVKMGRGSLIPPMLWRKIVDQYQKGVSQRKIAKSLKLSSSTVHNIIQRFRESGTISVRKGQASHLHLLCVDMTGHEGTTRTNTDDYSIQGQVKRIRHQGCEYIFIFGNQNESKFDSQMHEAEHSQYTLNIPLILSTLEEMLKLCSHTSILQGLVDVQIPHSDFYHQVYMGIMSENSKYALHEHIQQITTPLQVIWGKQDQVGTGPSQKITWFITQNHNHG
uniref:Uncharacterized protein n=1 Tax=Cyprinus carpio TaxID=7962 RepID=A0A8C2HEK3_CYPCA